MPRTPQLSNKTAQREERWVTWTITDSGFHIEVWQGNKKADEHDEILNPKPQNPDDSAPMAAAVAADIFEQRYGRQPFPDEIWGTGKHWKGPTEFEKEQQAWRKRKKGAKLSNREAQAGPWNQGIDVRNLKYGYGGDIPAGHPCAWLKLGQWEVTVHNFGGDAYTMDARRPCDGACKYIQHPNTAVFVNDFINNLKINPIRKGQSGPWNADRKKDEEYAEMLAKGEMSGGFAIYTGNQFSIEENALSGDEPIELDQAKWDQLNKDIEQVEHNCLAGLNKIGFRCRSEGHSNDDLVGTCWVANAESAALLRQVVDNEPIRTSSGTIGGWIPDEILWKDVSDLGQQLLDVSVDFFDWDEHKEMLRIGQAGPWNQPQPYKGTLYGDLLAAGIPTDSHESDLYFLLTPESSAILKRYPNKSASSFISQIDGKRWMEAPFAYLPFWEKKQRRGQAGPWNADRTPLSSVDVRTLDFQDYAGFKSKRTLVKLGEWSVHVYKWEAADGDLYQANVFQLKTVDGVENVQTYSKRTWGGYGLPRRKDGWLTADQVNKFIHEVPLSERTAQAGPWNKDSKLPPPERKPRDTIPSNVLAAAKSLKNQGFRVCDGDENNLAWFANNGEGGQLMPSDLYDKIKGEIDRGVTRTDWLNKCTRATPEQDRCMKLVDWFQQSVPMGEIFDTDGPSIISFSRSVDDRARNRQARLSNRVAQAGPWNKGPTRTFGVFHVHRDQTDWVENFKMVDSAILLTQTLETDDTWGFVLSSRGDVKYITKGHEDYVEKLLNRCKSTLVMKVKRSAQAGPWNSNKSFKHYFSFIYGLESQCELHSTRGLDQNPNDAIARVIGFEKHDPQPEARGGIVLRKPRAEILYCTHGLEDEARKLSGYWKELWNTPMERDAQAGPWNNDSVKVDVCNIPYTVRAENEWPSAIITKGGITFTIFKQGDTGFFVIAKDRDGKEYEFATRGRDSYTKEYHAYDHANDWINDFKSSNRSHLTPRRTAQAGPWNKKPEFEMPEQGMDWADVLAFLKQNDPDDWSEIEGAEDGDHWMFLYDCPQKNDPSGEARHEATIAAWPEDFHCQIHIDGIGKYEGDCRKIPGYTHGAGGRRKYFGQAGPWNQLDREGKTRREWQASIIKTCEYWHHEMGPWEKVHDRKYRSICLKCGESTTVDQFGVYGRAPEADCDAFRRPDHQALINRQAQAGPWNKPTEDMVKWDTLARTLVFESKAVKEGAIKSEAERQGVAADDPDFEIDWQYVGDTPCAFITEDGELLDFCLPDYFRGFHKGYAQISTPWSGTGRELQKEVLTLIGEVWPDEDEQGNLRVGVRLSNRQGQAGPWNSIRKSHQISVRKMKPDSLKRYQCYWLGAAEDNTPLLKQEGTREETLLYITSHSDLSAGTARWVMMMCDSYGEYTFQDYNGFRITQGQAGPWNADTNDRLVHLAEIGEIGGFFSYYFGEITDEELELEALGVQWSEDVKIQIERDRHIIITNLSRLFTKLGLATMGEQSDDGWGGNCWPKTKRALEYVRQRNDQVISLTPEVNIPGVLTGEELYAGVSDLGRKVVSGGIHFEGFSEKKMRRVLSSLNDQGVRLSNRTAQSGPWNKPEAVDPNNAYPPDIETPSDYKQYQKDFQKGVARFEDCRFSTGSWNPDPDFDYLEGHMSSSCDICHRDFISDSYNWVIGWLKGAREHNFDPEFHWDGEACQECVYYNEYGKLDDTKMMELEDYHKKSRKAVKLSNRQAQAGPWNEGRTLPRNKAKVWKQEGNSYIVELFDARGSKIASRGTRKQTVDFIVGISSFSFQNIEAIMNRCDQYGQWTFQRLPTGRTARRRGFEFLVKLPVDQKPDALGCAMVSLSAVDSVAVLEEGKKIAEEDLYTDDGGDGKGRENEVHCTVLYGICTSANYVQDALEGIGAPKMTLGEISLFENPEKNYDVVKIEVTSPDIEKMNAALKVLPHKTDYPTWKGHITLAYCKKGTGKKYVGKCSVTGREVVGESLVYNPPASENIEKREAAIVDPILARAMQQATREFLADTKSRVYGGGRSDKRQPADGYDINCGLCEEWAERVRSLYEQATGRDDVEVLDPCNITGDDREIYGHTFIRLHKMIYDAECPQGVKSWEQLPLFVKESKREAMKIVGKKAEKHDLLERFPFLDCPALSEVAEKLNPDPKKYYAGRNLLQDALQQGCPVTEDPGLDAVAQYDGHTIKVNPDRIKNASDVKIQAVLVHEVVHLLRDRLAGAKPGGEDEKPVMERDGERMALQAEAQFLMDNGLGQLEAEESVVGSLPKDLQKAARAIFDEVWAPKEAPETPVDAPEPVPAPSSQEA